MSEQQLNQFIEENSYEIDLEFEEGVLFDSKEEIEGEDE